MSRFRRWYVIADGGRARILAGDPRLHELEPVNDMESSAVHNKSHDLGSDRPGHTHESVGGSRHAVEAPDYHAKATLGFAEALASAITEGFESQAYDLLVLVAPSRFLSVLRASLPSAVDRLVEATLAKDLTHLPLGSLTERLAEIRRTG
ncbi:MAG TPA: host attachment protein [Stellaceae bacterium]|nr:host attachment protein [Stellaceae bacterium]